MDGTIYCDSRDDAKEWSTIKSACKVLMFSDEELNDILRLLSAVLQLGNLKFQGKKTWIGSPGIIRVCCFSDYHAEYGYVCSGQCECPTTDFEITQGKILLDIYAEISKLSFVKLDERGLSDGLLKRTIFAHGEAVVTPLNQEQAMDVR